MTWLRKRRPLFSPAQSERIVDTIRAAEKQTSGEIRLFVERRCKYVDALDRASRVFYNLEMEQTQLRNGVLFYLAVEDKQLAVFADEGIHKAVDADFWKQTLHKVVSEIQEGDMVQGICDGIKIIGEALRTHFPYQPGVDKNELPDEIVFGN
ncbi:MAG: TPM domain-containing protein [Chitinophagaceae bacterium]|nr:TPM domain-containing protein [Chitinophagaceae bacterium]